MEPGIEQRKKKSKPTARHMHKTTGRSRSQTLHTDKQPKKTHMANKTQNWALRTKRVSTSLQSYRRTTMRVRMGNRNNPTLPINMQQIRTTTRQIAAKYWSAGNESCRTAWR
jgi:hypothetical protein